MSYKTKIYLMLTVSFAAVLISLILALPENVGLCAKNDINCIHNYIDRFNNIIQLVFAFSVVLAILSSVLLFFEEKVFIIWSKFAIVYFPIAIILIAIAPTANGTLIGFDKKSATFFLAVIFAIVSIIIIAIKSFKLRKQGG